MRSSFTAALLLSGFLTGISALRFAARRPAAQEGDAFVSFPPVETGYCQSSPEGTWIGDKCMGRIPDGGMVGR